MATIASIDELEQLYRQPSERVRTKKRDHVDANFAKIIAASPFVLLATADGSGCCDVSPRGGPPGFVKLLDDRHVALPDLNGNNLIDSLRNIVVNPHVGLLFLVPGQNETLRLDGPAHLVTDDDILDRFTDEVRRPPLAIVVEVANLFTHCAKAFRRGSLWDTATWPSFERPLLLDARYRQLGLDATFDEYAAANECGIAADLDEDRPLPTTVAATTVAATATATASTD